MSQQRKNPPGFLPDGFSDGGSDEIFFDAFAGLRRVAADGHGELDVVGVGKRIHPAQDLCHDGLLTSLESPWKHSHRCFQRCVF